MQRPPSACPGCGASVDPSMRFCGACGLALAGEGPGAARPGSRPFAGTMLGMPSVQPLAPEPLPSPAPATRPLRPLVPGWPAPVLAAPAPAAPASPMPVFSAPKPAGEPPPRASVPSARAAPLPPAPAASTGRALAIAFAAGVLFTVVAAGVAAAFYAAQHGLLG